MLKLNEVSKAFPVSPSETRVALAEVSIHVGKGELASVIGSNGSGKSTLLRTISGEIPLDSGTIELDGVNLGKLPFHERSRVIGRVFQDPLLGTASEFSIEENLALAQMKKMENRKNLLGIFHILQSSLKSALKKENRLHFQKLLSGLHMGLEHRLDTPVSQLSGGQRQALTLLMATLSQPKLLLLDEHCAALDPKTAETVIQLTVRLVQQNQLSTLMVTHNMDHALKYSDHIIFMDQGRIKLHLKKDELKGSTIQDLLALFKTQNDRILLGSLL